MILITVALAAVVATFVTSLGGRGTPPAIMLKVTANTIDNHIIISTISHWGGDDLDISELLVLGSDINGNMMIVTLSPSSGIFSFGEAITGTYTYGTIQVDTKVTIEIIHKPSKMSIMYNPHVQVI